LRTLAYALGLVATLMLLGALLGWSPGQQRRTAAQPGSSPARRRRSWRSP